MIQYVITGIQHIYFIAQIKIVITHHLNIYYPFVYPSPLVSNMQLHFQVVEE